MNPLNETIAVNQHPISEWTGLKGRIGAWYLTSSLRRLSEILFLGDLRSAFIKEICGIIGGNEIALDVGAGSGYFSLPVAKRLPNGKVICLDLSGEMLNRLERLAVKNGLRNKIQILRGEAASIQLSDESVDLAFSNGVFHELANPEVVLTEMVRVLKPGGWTIVTDFRDTWMGRLMGTAHGEQQPHGPFTVKRLAFLFVRVGLTNIKVSPIRHWLMAVGRKESSNTMVKS